MRSNEEIYCDICGGIIRKYSDSEQELAYCLYIKSDEFVKKINEVYSIAGRTCFNCFHKKLRFRKYYESKNELDFYIKLLKRCKKQ